MSFATVAPGQSNVPGGPTGPPVCENCSTSTTPLWRRDESGTVLCNACGLFLKLHGRPRPISLKTDTIKSRNRVKTSIPSIAAAQQAQLSQSQTDNSARTSKRKSLPAAYPDTSSHVSAAQAQAAAAQAAAAQRQGSRSGTPSNINIAPQAMFDSAILDASTAMLSQGSYNGTTDGGGGNVSSVFGSSLGTGTGSGNGASGRGASGNARIPSPSALQASLHTSIDHSNSAGADVNERLKTRVSELEVINDLFRGRVAELERSEESARALVAELQTRVRELERDRELAGLGNVSTSDGLTSGMAEPGSKRLRLENDGTGSTNDEGEGDGQSRAAESNAEE